MVEIDRCVQQIATMCMRAQDQKMMESWLRDLLTPGEIEEIAERINIFAALLEGKTQREVADELGISVTTVNRGAKEMKYGKGAAAKIVWGK